MRILRPEAIKSREITEPALAFGRRAFLRAASGLGLAAVAGCLAAEEEAAAAPPGPRLPDVSPGPADFATDEAQTDRESATTYNNFYEFSTGKSDPARNAGSFRTRPWSVAIEGEVARPGTIDLDDLLRLLGLEERVYRHRCVEAWSMVIPWVGFPLGDLLARFEPTSRGKFVAFETLHDAEQMPGQHRSVLDWPYREGLRIDEAMHPLTLLAVGMYGKVLPNQNGAPLRLVVPWKYGFKSIKSIVKIRLAAKQPRTTWQMENAREYGFFANVNPEVSHPRWSQARERRIGEWGKRPTLMLNGYGEQVESLYRGMDLRKFY